MLRQLSGVPPKLYARPAFLSMDDGKDRRARLANQRRLRELKRDHAKAVRIISSHDVMEFEGTAHRAIGALPGRPARA
ncbi:MAG TPA: hypothetical protein VGD45_03470 [Steroidobacter sp.]